MVHGASFFNLQIFRKISLRVDATMLKSLLNHPKNQNKVEIRDLQAVLCQKIIK